MQSFYKSTLIIIFVLATRISAEGGDKQKSISQINGQPGYVVFNINKISTGIFFNGRYDKSPAGSGLIYPKGSGKTAAYLSGFLWGGKINDIVHIGGSSQRSGLMPGKILSTGVAENYNNENVRLYRVRPDYQTSDFASEIDEGEGTFSEVKFNYEKDWTEWPAHDGAPFDDKNNNGIYEPEIDIPGIPGAAQTVWFVANDLDTAVSRSLYGTNPMGMEVQVTTWGYNIPGPSENIIFKKYILINKGRSNIDEMYVSVWSDPDIGDSDDDMVGCDTLMDLGFVYNGDYNDEVYGATPPAVGFRLLQGPVVESSAADEAVFMGKNLVGMKNLCMTSLGWIYNCCEPVHGDPTLGIETGAREMYRYMKGKQRDGTSHIVPNEFGGGTTLFPVSGDPITWTGFTDGYFYGAGDRRLQISSGPFNMAVGDTQEIIFAQILGGAEPGVSSINAVALMKYYAKHAKFIYDNKFQFPHNMPVPKLTASPYDQKVVLSWGDDQTMINYTERYDQFGYRFQGYNVYQLPAENARFDESYKIASFDLEDGITDVYDNDVNPATEEIIHVLAHQGTDSGLQRFLVIDKNYFTNEALNNGSLYYYAVTAYYVSEGFEMFKTLESQLQIKSAVPQVPLPGVVYGASVGDILSINHSIGTSGGFVEVEVLDPQLSIGNEYEINFDEVEGTLTWNVVNLSTDEMHVRNYANFSGGNDNPIVDGMIIRVIDNPGNPLSTNDVFTFTSPLNIVDPERMQLDLTMINVFPNPFYVDRAGSQEYNESFVSFTHLPQRATIRILNMAGHLLRTIVKESNIQFEQWDLKNEHGENVSSGLYIALIELPDLGLSKILKLAVILH